MPRQSAVQVYMYYQCRFMDCQFVNWVIKMHESIQCRNQLLNIASIEQCCHLITSGFSLLYIMKLRFCCLKTTQSASCLNWYRYTQVWRKGRRKSAWYNCLHMHLIATDFHTYSSEVTNLPCWCAIWHSVWVSFIYASDWVHLPCLSNDFGKLILVYFSPICYEVSLVEVLTKTATTTIV